MFKNAIELIEWIETRRRIAPKVSLERFKEICNVYGNPQDDLKYIHVGGTNGKGSTVNFIKDILRDAGYKVATYVSPYVIKFNERITYEGEYIKDNELLEIGNYIISKFDELDKLGLSQPSFFEFVTLLAFIYFSRIKKLDFVVLEVGLGGLLDSTNIITPLVSVITSISFDHMNVLGNTIQEIAANKLGIVKDSRPLVILKNDEITELVEEVTEKNNSKLVYVDKQNIKNTQVSIDCTSFNYLEFTGLTLRMLGNYQAENAALAIEVIKILREEYSYVITNENIDNGLQRTFWPGRLQVISKQPLVILDGAHNIDAINRLREFLIELKQHESNHNISRFLRIVFAVSADKAKDQMISVLDDIADEIIFTSFSYKHSDDASYLLELSHSSNKSVELDLDKLAKDALINNKKITVFCGSLYFVSELLSIFESIKK